ncbi:DUF3967 domain-containing protein [Natranaerobius trueperi]|uniref:HTH merR-type domain-containing protein n=1 Tax=Natranaerobius trueperi TaxID=759412 RepID=A0A226BWQ1_9FIRM|nr:DUF3967 domain-containing protein [Natranaerobius trueperi]OWZ82734.1 hypothetical protein CDO51_12450 [Natranaerobius trueperi]
MGRTITLKEAETKTGIPSRTIRRYIHNHGQRLPIIKEGNKYLIEEYALPLLTRIREFYDQGMTVKDVDDKLDSDGDSLLIEVDRVTEQPAMDHEQMKQFLKTIIERQDSKIKELETKVDNLSNLLQEGQRQQSNLTELANKQTQNKIEELEEKLEERDQKLMEAIRELQEKKKPWWKKLMGK